MCKVLQIPRSTYYYESKVKESTDEITPKVIEIFKASRNNYGTRKIKVELEKAGCHVIYGLVGLKTHSKITLVVRREEDGIKRYVHLGTGNYNDSTAKQYTDIGLFTCSEQIGEDATAVFNMLSGYSEPLFWNKLTLAPLWLKDKFLYLIKIQHQDYLLYLYLMTTYLCLFHQ